MRVSFIGSGNVATQLAQACLRAHISIINIYSRKFGNAQSLAQKCNAEPALNISDLVTDIDLLILAVNDDALPELATQLKNFPCPVVHTAGSVPMSIIYTDVHPYGVLYPLQTISLHKELNIQKLPFFVEASDERLLKTLEQLVNQLGAQFLQANSEQRLYMHIAAVFACNFSNYMYSIAHKISEQHQIPFESLVPLILETAEKLKTMKPLEAQTGPAKRNDEQTMQKHKQALSMEPQWLELYTLISEGIKKNQNS
jgi:predicted short-subunit dehydrogenase-like oxidoreductase (DUF2520 family)